MKNNKRSRDTKSTKSRARKIRLREKEDINVERKKRIPDAQEQTKKE